MTEEQKVDALADKITQQTLQGLANDPNVNLDRGSAESIKHDVKKEVADVVMNQLNQEPWYQSRVIIGSVVALAATLLKIAGTELDGQFVNDTTELILQIAQVAGVAFALYGRLVAKKPLGK